MKFTEIVGNDFFINMNTITEENKSRRQRMMEMYKLIQTVSSACDKNINEFKKLQSKHEILQKIVTDYEDNYATTEFKRKFKNTVINFLLNYCCEEFEHDSSELLFFIAVTFNLPKLKEIIKQSDHDEINQTCYSDSIIVFSLKYGDITNHNFVECIKVLIDAGVDINISDITGKFAIDYVTTLYNKTENTKIQNNLIQVGKYLLDKKICISEEPKTEFFIVNILKIELTKYKFANVDIKTKLFYWISKYKTNEFLSFKKIHHYVNCDNGENTLLQFAVNKSNNMLAVVEYLLKKGADPNKTTEANPLSPLEIAARNNYDTIFKLILSWKETKISEDQFNNFVKWRGHSVKRELFGVLLDSDKIDPTFVFKKTGNTPLHYAIRLCHRNAVQKLLRRPDVSLTVKNYAGKCPLDILDATDLNIYFDSCLIFDNRKTIDFNSTEYKMQFRFRRLTDGSDTEVDVISLIGKYNHLEHLLAHPFIHTYIMIKWFKVRIYFWTILAIQALFFLILSILFYRFPFSSTLEHIICFLICIIHVFCKCWVFFSPKEVLQECLSLSFKPTTLHEYCEILLMITFIGSFWFTEFRAFCFIEMAIVFLLIAGYHPKLSHWSIMLQKVFKTFTLLLIFFSLLTVAFAASFHIMFQDHRFFTALYRSVFMAYFMTIGEINVSEVDFETTPFGGYLLFFLFAMSMSVVIINFWTGVAIRDIDKFEKRSEVSALKNVIAFVAFIEKHIYSIDCLKKNLPNPLIFSQPEETYIVDFYINKDDQFEPKFIKDGVEIFLTRRFSKKRHFPKQINKVCFEKIRAHYFKLQNNTTEQKILEKLDKLVKSLECTNQNKGNAKKFKRQTTVV